MHIRNTRIGVGICVHNEEDYIGYALQSIYDFADVIAVCVNVGVPWGGGPERLDRTLEIVESFPDPLGKIRIRAGQWAIENDQRNENLDMVRGDVGYFMIVDSDEIYTSVDLARLRRYIMWRPHIGQFRIKLETYWKTHPFCRIDPPITGNHYIVTRIRPDTRFAGRRITTQDGIAYVAVRETFERPKCTVPRHVAVCHHFSYARTSERILAKLRNSMHRYETLPGWYERVWLGWDRDRDMENLYPTNPSVFGRALPVGLEHLPEIMREHPFAKAPLEVAG
jgi:hypothetical protein